MKLHRSFIIALLATLLFAYGGILIAGDVKTQDWNASFETIPGDSDNISEGAQRIRNFKRDIRERVAQDHYMDLAGTQADHGEHKKVTFQAPLASDPTNAANKGYLYTKDVSSKAELHWEDEDGNVGQITNAGAVMAFPSGTKLLFYQDTCPAGWTIDSTMNDKVLLVTKGSAAGGETGGTEHSTGTWQQPDHTLTIDEIPAHYHFNGVGDNHSGSYIYNASQVGVPGVATKYLSSEYGSPSYQGLTSETGGGSAHDHGDTWRPAGYNVICCVKD